MSLTLKQAKAKHKRLVKNGKFAKIAGYETEIDGKVVVKTGLVTYNKKGERKIKEVQIEE